MKIGAWIHAYDDLGLNQQIETAAQNGLSTIRSYSFDYALKTRLCTLQTPNNVIYW